MYIKVYERVQTYTSVYHIFAPGEKCFPDSQVNGNK